MDTGVGVALEAGCGRRLGGCRSGPGFGCVASAACSALQRLLQELLRANDGAFIALVERPLADTLGCDQAGALERLQVRCGGGLGHTELVGDEHNADAVIDEIPVALGRKMRARIAQPVKHLQSTVICQRLQNDQQIGHRYIAKILYAVGVTDETYDRLLALLNEYGANYRLIDHPPEGRTEAVSALRGHPPGEAAKCIVLRIKTGKKQSRYVLAVVPGGRRVDINAIKTLLGGTYAGFAEAQTAERLAASVAGTVLPFALDPELELIVDPDVLAVPTLYFNAARLDRSIALGSDDYKRIARPSVATIAAPAD